MGNSEAHFRIARWSKYRSNTLRILSTCLVREVVYIFAQPLSVINYDGDETQLVDTGGAETRDQLYFRILHRDKTAGVVTGKSSRQLSWAVCSIYSHDCYALRAYGSSDESLLINLGAWRPDEDRSSNYICKNHWKLFYNIKFLI